MAKRKRIRPSNKPERSTSFFGEGMMEALDNLRAVRMSPEEAKKYKKKEKDKRDTEKKVGKSIRRQEDKIEKEAERKQQKLRQLRDDPDKRRRSAGGGGGGGGGFGALRGMEANLPGRRKMRRGGRVSGSYQDAFNRKQKRDSSSQYKMPKPAANDPRKSSYGSTKSTRPTQTSNRVKGTTNVRTEPKKRGGNPLFMKRGGLVHGNASKRADGIAKRGRTKGRKI